MAVSRCSLVILTVVGDLEVTIRWLFSTSIEFSCWCSVVQEGESEESQARN